MIILDGSGGQEHYLPLRSFETICLTRILTPHAGYHNPFGDGHCILSFLEEYLVCGIKWN